METATMTETLKTENPFSKTIALALNIHMLGVSRTVKTARNNDTDKTVSAEEAELVSVNKKTLECPEYEAIKKKAGELRNWLAKKQIQGGRKLYRSATYPIAVGMLEDVDIKVLGFIDEFNDLVDKFCQVYESVRDKALVKLKNQKILGVEYDVSNISDYPSVDKVRQEFFINHEYIAMGPDPSLGKANAELYRREIKKFQDNIASATSEVRDALRLFYQELLDHAINALKPGPDGKKKRVYDSLLGNMKEFLLEFNSKNITNDKELEEVVLKLRSVLAGKTTESLRKDEDMRALTAEALEKLKAEVDANIGPVVGRKIRNLD